MSRPRDPLRAVPAAATLAGALGGVCTALATRQAFNNPMRVPIRSSAVLAFDGAALGLLAGLVLARLGRAKPGLGRRLVAALCVLLCAGVAAVAGWLARDARTDPTGVMSIAAGALSGVVAGVLLLTVRGGGFSGTAS